MKQVNVGVIGTGLMGGLHGRIAYEQPESNLICIADIDEVRAKETAGNLKAKAYTDYREMIEKEKDLDGIIITTPDQFHREPVEAAAEAGLDIFLEKPIASTIEDADAIIKSCSKADVKLMIGYVLRYEPAYVRIKQACEEGSIGDFLMAYARRNGFIAEAHRLGGRVSVAHYLLVHDCDQILWYTNSKVKEVYSKGVQAQVKKELGVDDFIWSMVTLENGGLAIIESGWGLTNKMCDWKTPSTWASAADFKMDVTGTKGSLYANFHPMNLYACDEEGWKFPDTRFWPEINGKLAGALRDETSDFFDMMLKDRDSPITGEEAKGSLAAAEAAVESIKTGKPVRV